MPGSVAIVFIATLECTIGLLLMSGRGLRIAVYLLVSEFIGILSPIVLLTGRLFAGPHGAPTLEGQYVLKDITLVASAMVVAAARGRAPGPREGRGPPRSGRWATATPSTPSASSTSFSAPPARIARSRRSATSTASPQATYHQWRDEALHGAAQALDSSTRSPDAAGLAA